MILGPCIVGLGATCPRGGFVATRGTNQRGQCALSKGNLGISKAPYPRLPSLIGRHYSGLRTLTCRNGKRTQQVNSEIRIHNSMPRIPSASEHKREMCSIGEQNPTDILGTIFYYRECQIYIVHTANLQTMAKLGNTRRLGDLGLGCTQADSVVLLATTRRRAVVSTRRNSTYEANLSGHRR